MGEKKSILTTGARKLELLIWIERKHDGYFEIYIYKNLVNLHMGNNAMFVVTSMFGLSVIRG
jgi:hypothetical protein